MKQLSYCDSIERILISEKIHCDAVILYEEALQYTLLYREELTKTFTDNISKTLFSFIARQCLIKGIPKVCKLPNIDTYKFGKTLTGINTTMTAYQILKYSSQYYTEKKKISQLDNPEYIRFYSTYSNAFILLNKRLLSEDFDDNFQVNMDNDKLLGIYTNPKTDRKLSIYKDHFDLTYKIQNKLIV